MREKDTFNIVCTPGHRPGTWKKPQGAPTDTDGWKALKTLSPDALKDLGLLAWCNPDEPDWPHAGKTLFLFPAEWYQAIPDGFEIVDINGTVETFIQGETDDDIRFGLLAYGVLVP